jgi:integrase
VTELAETTKQPKKRKKHKHREAFGAIRLRGKRHQASYVGPDGIRYYGPHTYSTAGDARGWLSRQRIAIDDLTWSATAARGDAIAKDSKSDTLGTYGARWISTRTNRSGRQLAPRTIVENKRLLAGPLKALADQRLSVLTPEEIRTWYSGQVESGKVTQASRAYGLLSAILNTAVRDRRIPVNPCDVTGAQNATTGKKVKPPSANELDKILEVIDPKYRAAVILAAWTACRYGEVTELRRKDIILNRSAEGAIETITVQVERAVTHTTGLGYIVGKTKTAAGERAITLPPHVNDFLIEHLDEHVEGAPESLLYLAADGITHLSESSFVNRWYPARLAAGRPDMPFHALRHHGATKYAQTGATLKEIQDMATSQSTRPCVTSTRPGATRNSPRK